MNAVTVGRAARLGDAWMCGPVESLEDCKDLLGHYQQACKVEQKQPQWILRRFGWIKPTRREVEEAVLPAYVAGLIEHWKEGGYDPNRLTPRTAAILARLDAGKTVPPAEIAHERLIWGAPDDAIRQIQHFRDETGADHVHVAFGTGLHAVGVNQSSMGEFEELAAMMRLYGQEVISAFKGQ
jgi:alkanesulfonate monooxygenase SsuD/methylene tetrahydromethanopterin reductase-like flavin-dependent oxidoreductase (luciferase family)